MVSLQIELPDDMILKIKALSSNAEDFVLASVRNYLQEHELRKEAILIEGYKYSKSENLPILQDFKHIDTENWDEY